MKMQVTIERIRHNGALVCSALFSGRLISRTFYGYTMKEARKLFVEGLASGKAL